MFVATTDKAVKYIGSYAKGRKLPYNLCLWFATA